MKKLFLGILTMMYMTMASGIGVEVHYCMGKNAGFELYGPPNGKCTKCGMQDKKTGCCHDEHKFYKLSDSHKNVNNNISMAGAGVGVLNLSSLFQFRPRAHTFSSEINDYSPPDDTGPSPIVLHCIFRI